MAKVYASLASTTIDPTQYTVGQGQLFTRQVYDFLNMTNGNTLFYKSRVFKDANLIKNPLKRRYEKYENAKSLAGSPYIGERCNVYEKLGRQIVFLDDVGGLSGFTYNEGYSDLPNTEMISNMKQAEKAKGFSELDSKHYLYNIDENNEYTEPTNYEYLKNRLLQFSKHTIANAENDGRFDDMENKFVDKIQKNAQVFNVNLEDLKIALKNLSPIGKVGYIEADEVESYNTRVRFKEPFVYPFDSDTLKSAKSIDQMIDTQEFGRTRFTISSNDNGGKTISTTYLLYDETTEGEGHSFEQYRGDGPHDNQPEGTLVDLIDEYSAPKNTILGKTNELFRNGKIGSLINRFHTKAQDTNEIETAVDSVYGLSRGRNLKKLTPTVHNGYDNPYCRVWTSHHQYSKMSDRIRPFVTSAGFKTIAETQSKFKEGLRPNSGHQRLSDMSSLQDNGLPLIAPYDTFNGDSNIDQSDLIKRCMFSIENLAWKDVNVNAKVDDTGKPVLTKEQQGPLGGRIMWFPPYNLKFNENVGVNWEGNDFIGRGEQIYTYKNTERSGTLDFTILIDHPSIVDKWANVTESTRDKEEELLRFFAGCGELKVDEETMVPVYNRKTVNDDIERLIEEPVPPLKDGTRLVVDSVPEVYQNFEKRFYVFFPNNLSGEDYMDDPRVIEDYLFNGYSEKPGGYEVSNSFHLNGCINMPEIVGKHTTYKYHVDKQTVNQYLKGKETNNLDLASFGLNDNFVGILTGDNEEQKTILKQFFQLEGYPKENIMNFKDAENELKKLITQEIRDKYDIKVVVNGFASAHGGYVSTTDGEDDNKRLSTKRANYVMSLLKSYNIFDPDDIRFGGNRTVPVANQSINAFDAKAGRSAEVIISFTVKSDLTPDSESELIDAAVIVAERPKKDRREVKRQTQIVDIVEYEKISDESSFDNEYLYFKKLGSQDSLIKKNIVDKVKYFDPAFHSITPEGFNARLTFLHQCTRQGPTYSVADNSFSNTDGNGKKQANFAGNLSFGRPPICVLRIGDFYYTKIIIDSLSINYDGGGGVQWDLNPEGIGIQPMIANVTIGFKFLGGSDLSGPIERLQNAVSSNFFANTSVYDRKSDYRKTPIKINDKQSQKSEAWNASFIADEEKTRHTEFNPE